MHTTRLIPIDRIKPFAHQARRYFDPAALEDLAQSIRDSGVIQPVIVCSCESGFELIAGERRWRASQLAGKHVIPAIVRDDLTAEERNVFSLIENLQRESLTPMDTAYGLEQLCRLGGLTHAQAGVRIGKSREYVTNLLRLLALVPAVANLVNEGQISAGHAKIIAVQPVNDQLRIAKIVIGSRLSVRGLERLVRELPQSKSGSNTTAASLGPDHLSLERQLSDALSAKIAICDKGQGAGEIRITYNSLDELDGLLAQLLPKDPSYGV